jgi:hypothetical protein
MFRLFLLPPSAPHTRLDGIVAQVSPPGSATVQVSAQENVSALMEELRQLQAEDRALLQVGGGRWKCHRSSLNSACRHVLNASAIGTPLALPAGARRAGAGNHAAVGWIGAGGGKVRAERRQVDAAKAQVCFSSCTDLPFLDNATRL